MRRMITGPHPEQRHANNLKPGVAPRELPCRPILKTSLHLLAWSVASSKTCTPSCRGSTPRCAGWPSLAHARGLVARLAACHLIAHKEKRRPADVCRQHFADDRDLANLIELKGAVTPAQTTVATWAAELAACLLLRRNRLDIPQHRTDESTRRLARGRLRGKLHDGGSTTGLAPWRYRSQFPNAVSRMRASRTPAFCNCSLTTGSFVSR
jgi:hypothetical protein